MKQLYYLVLLCCFGITACQPPQNPLLEVEKGIWLPVATSPHPFTYRPQQQPDTVLKKNLPLFVIGDTLDQIMLRSDGYSRMERVKQNEEGDWFLHWAQDGKLSVNDTKDTLSLHYIDEQHQANRVQYVHAFSPVYLMSTQIEAVITNMTGTEWILENAKHETSLNFMRDAIRSNNAAENDYSVWIVRKQAMVQEASMPVVDQKKVRATQFESHTYMIDIQTSYMFNIRTPYMFIELNEEEQFLVIEVNSAADQIKLISTNWRHPEWREKGYLWKKVKDSNLYIEAVRQYFANIEEGSELMMLISLAESKRDSLDQEFFQAVDYTITHHDNDTLRLELLEEIKYHGDYLDSLNKRDQELKAW